MICFYDSKSYGQTEIAEINQNKVVQIKQILKSEIDYDEFTLNGKVVSGFYQAAIGHPYFQSNSWRKGSVFFDGKKYENVYLKFNLETNQLICRIDKENASYSVELFRDKVSGFTIENEEFQKIYSSKEKNKFSFFYVISQGKANYLVEYKKYRNNPGNGTMAEYIEKHTNYVLYNGKLKKFKSKNTLINALEDKKEKIKEYIQAKELIVNQSDVYQIKLLFEYYNNL